MLTLVLEKELIESKKIASIYVRFIPFGERFENILYLLCLELAQFAQLRKTQKNSTAFIKTTNSDQLSI